MRRSRAGVRVHCSTARLLDSSPSRPPRPPSSVKPPTKTASRRKSACSAAVSRSWLQAIVSRIVCCRAGRSRAPPVSSGNRGSSRASSAAGGSTLTRAAASSIASGSPSSRRQIAADRGGVLGGQREVGLDRPRPLDEQPHRRRPAARRRDGVGPALGQRQRRHRVLVLARQPQPHPAGDQHLQPRAAAEQLGHQRARPRPPARSCRAPAAAAGRARNAGSRSTGGSAALSRTPRAWAIAGATRPGSLIGARRTKATPSGKSSATSAAAASASAGLADAAGAGQRQQAHVAVAQQPADRRHLRARGRSAA